MPRKKAKLVEIGQKIEVARRIVGKQQAIVEKLIANKKPSAEAEGTLRTYLSSLNHFETHQRQMRQAAKVKRGETRKYSN
jgi:hypothetical protein